MQKTCSVAEGFDAWERFADQFNQTPGREVSLARDYFNGPLWFEWGKALHSLLSSDTVPRSVDCGALSRRYCALLEANGFDNEGNVL